MMIPNIIINLQNLSETNIHLHLEIKMVSEMENHENEIRLDRRFNLEIMIKREMKTTHETEISLEMIYEIRLELDDLMIVHDE